MIARWREVGLAGVFIGFEKSDQAGLETVNKHDSVENNEQALEILRQQGIEPDASFIVDPDYGHGDFAALRAYVRRLRLKVTIFTVLTPLPGTTLFEESKKRLRVSNYEFFDLLHAVLPTRLETLEFCEELASLYRKAYPGWKLGLAKMYLSLRDLWSQSPGPASWQRMLVEVGRLRDAQAYLKDWDWAQAQSVHS